MLSLLFLLVAEPTVYHLIATFLEKAECLPDQSPRAAGVGGNVEAVPEERRVVLVNCALLLGSLLHWDLALLEKKYGINKYVCINCTAVKCPKI